MSSGDKGRNSAHRFSREAKHHRGFRAQIFLPATTLFFSGDGEQFHFLPELSTMNSNNSALCCPDSLVKPTEQNGTNRIPGKKGVAHRLKLTTSPQVAKLHLSHRKNSEAKSKPWAKFIMPGKRRGEINTSSPWLLIPTLPPDPGSRQRLCSQPALRLER